MPDELKDVAGAARALRHRLSEKDDAAKDRSWERKKRHAEKTTQVSFRDFPRALNERLKEIAGQEGKTVAQVAVPMIVYALDQLDNGRASLAEMEILARHAESR